jgi:hypothetical protein
VRSRALAAVLILLLVPACGETRRPVVPDAGAGGAELAGVSLSRDVWPILIVWCRNCHTTGSGAQQVPDMLLTDPSTTWRSWVRVNSRCNPNFFRVLPGDSALSFVFDKISHPAPICGQRMPLEGPMLDEVQQATIRDWIDQGALNN